MYDIHAGADPVRLSGMNDLCDGDTTLGPLTSRLTSDPGIPGLEGVPNGSLSMSSYSSSG